MGELKKWKIQRALGLELPGLGKPGALEKRNYPPGQHGRTAKRKLSAYAERLREKQKLLFHYGLREEQLRRFVRTAKQKNTSNWIEGLINLLERRLDNVVFRLGFARSMAAARQLVSHGHVLVNVRFITIGRAVLRIGDVVSLTEYARGPMTEKARSAPRLTLPSYLRFNEDGATHAGVVQSIPGSEHVPFAFTPQFVAEYYAQRGV